MRWSEASVRWRWRDLPLREKGIIVVAIPVLPLLLSAALFYYTHRRAEEADRWVSQALAVRVELSRLTALLVDGELGARGYLLTRSPEPLATYRTATAALLSSYKTLQTLVTDPEQRARLRRLPLRLRDRPLSSIILYVDSTMPGAPVPLELLARSRASMWALREDLAAMQAAEDVLLTSRSARARQTRRQALGVVIGGAVVGLIGGVIAALILTATVARRVGEVTANARRLASGETVGPMAVSRDEVGVLAGALERASDLLRERDIALQRQLDEVAATNRELEAFSYSVSHDLRAPLRHVAGFASLLEKRAGDGLDPEGRRHLRTIVEAAARMGRLIDDLLEFSRMGRADMVREAVNLNDVIQDVVREVEQETRDRRIAWTMHPLPPVAGDQAMLRMALANLVSNAVKYSATREVAEIEIGAKPVVNGERVLYVRDNGVGFDMAYADKLFGVFQRLHTAEEFAGTGIGLANVRRIVQRHGGKTWAEDRSTAARRFLSRCPPEKDPMVPPDSAAHKPSSCPGRTVGVAVAAAAGPGAWPLGAFTGTDARARLLRAFMPRTVAAFLAASAAGHLLVAGLNTNPAFVAAVSVLGAAGLVAALMWRTAGVVGRAIDDAEYRLTQARVDLEAAVISRTAELTRVNQELEAFASSVSHDLRAPLRHMTGFANLLDQTCGEGLTDQGRAHLRRIVEAGGHMGRLIDDLLAFSRTAQTPLRTTHIDLTDLLTDVCVEAGRDLGGRSLEWHVGPLPSVEGDRALLRLAFTHLISNAIKYTKTRERAQIHVGALPAVNGERVLYVRDNGVGFDMAYAHKLFGVFQRLHGADQFDGTGIGLANVRRIVTRHGGRTWAEAAVDKGRRSSCRCPQKGPGRHDGRTAAHPDGRRQHQRRGADAGGARRAQAGEPG